MSATVYAIEQITWSSRFVCSMPTFDNSCHNRCLARRRLVIVFLVLLDLLDLLVLGCDFDFAVSPLTDVLAVLVLLLLIVCVYVRVFLSFIDAVGAVDVL